MMEQILPTCVSEKEPAKYPPVAAGRYILERSQTTTRAGAERNIMRKAGWLPNEPVCTTLMFGALRKETRLTIFLCGMVGREGD